MYQLARNILFRFDAEKVHHFSMNALAIFAKMPFAKHLLKTLYAPRQAESAELFGLHFRTKIGLAAGFDKNARYLTELDTLGFGFVEIGTVTPRPQAGNPCPRLFRLPEDKAIINRMGFNNDGAEMIQKRLAAFRKKIKNNGAPLIIGGNIGKNKDTPNEEAWRDYEICFLALHEHVDYFVVNVSSPNTPGLRDLQQKDSLHKILTHLQALNQKQATQKPILLKIAPDLAPEELNDIIDLAMEIQLDGLVATNTTINRSGLVTRTDVVEKTGPGGVSGKPLRTVSADICAHIAQRTGGRMPLISSGGIFSKKDVAHRMDTGASLIQIWTGFIYEGPGILKKITP